MKIDWNLDINTVPRGDRVFLLLEKGEKGNGELAVGMICGEIGDPIDCYWTWGGPNAGSDIDEIPVAWATLPADWFAPLDARSRDNQQHLRDLVTMTERCETCTYFAPLSPGHAAICFERWSHLKWNDAVPLVSKDYGCDKHRRRDDGEGGKP